MRILIVDDERWRHKTLERQYMGEEVEHAWKAKEAIWLLNTRPRYTVVQLDYDLQEEFDLDTVVHCEPDGDVMPTGMTVATGICAMPTDKRPAKVIVHTSSARMGTKMVAQLQRFHIDAVYKPAG